jgi:hypothetical protein
VDLGLLFSTKVPPRAKTPCGFFDPASPSTVHMTDEYLEPTEDLIIATRTLALTLGDWCGIEPIQKKIIIKLREEKGKELWEM